MGAVRQGVSEEGRSDEGLELVCSEHIPIQLVLRGQSAAPEHLPSLPQRVSRLGEMPPQGTGAGRNVGIFGDHPGRAPVRSAIANESTLSADPNGMATDGRPAAGEAKRSCAGCSTAEAAIGAASLAASLLTAAPNVV